MTIKGIDVASYQPSDYSTRGIDFVFIKITEGRSYTNPKWVEQRQTARGAGLVTGFYHFVRPGGITAQADYFLSKINLVAGDILALDWEDGGVPNADKDAWIRYVQRKAPGHRVVLYCNRDFWLHRDTTSFAGDGLWIADPDHPAGHPAIQYPWTFHQYSSAGGLDRNVADFDSRSALRSWATGPHKEDDDVPIRTSLGKIKDQALAWGKFTVLQWDREYADPEGTHTNGDYPGYVAPVSSWADFDVSVRVDGLKPGDEYQLRYEVHDWSGDASTGSWTEVHADAAATRGDQWVTGTMSKGVNRGQHCYVAIAVFPAGGAPDGRPAPKAITGRFTIRQDKQ